MNLFRTGTNNGTIDNYTTLVRPALQQQTANQQFGSDIFGLQRNARLQGAALQQLDRQPRNLARRGHAAVLPEFGHVAALHEPMAATTTAAITTAATMAATIRA